MCSFLMLVIHTVNEGQTPGRSHAKAKVLPNIYYCQFPKSRIIHLHQYIRAYIMFENDFVMSSPLLGSSMNAHPTKTLSSLHCVVVLLYQHPPASQYPLNKSKHAPHPFHQPSKHFHTHNSMTPNISSYPTLCLGGCRDL
jgi:hypothetical protein